MAFATAEKVLVTGATGFIAAHIVNQLFVLGYDVVGTVRSASKAEFIINRFPGFKYEIIADLTDEQAFDEVFKKHPDIKYVLHTASPVIVQGTEYFKSIVTPAIEGTLSALKAAQKYGKNVTKFVYTSSIVAVDQPPTANGKVVISESAWNPITLEDAHKDWAGAYYASKTFAEKAVWDFVKTESPKFGVSTILVPLVYGPPIHEITYDTLGSSLTLFKATYELPKDTKEISNRGVVYGDVRDVARTHVQALTDSRFDGKRILPSAGHTSDQNNLDILHQLRPDEFAHLPTGTPGSFKEDGTYTLDNAESRKLLNFEFIPLGKSLLDETDAFAQLKNNSAK